MRAERTIGSGCSTVASVPRPTDASTVAVPAADSSSRPSARTATAPFRSSHSTCSTWRTSAWPSTSIVGSTRSRRRGIHHARSPSRARTAGTSVIRTPNASTNTPTARPRAIGLIVESPSGTKAANTAIMITAAAVTTRALEVNPVVTACRASWWCT